MFIEYSAISEVQRLEPSMIGQKIIHILALSSWRGAAKKRYQAIGFPYNSMLKLSSSRVIRIDVPVLSVSWSFVDHSVIIQALRKGLIEREASDSGGVPRWKSSCPDRLAEATGERQPSYAIAKKEKMPTYLSNNSLSYVFTPR